MACIIVKGNTVARHAHRNMVCISAKCNTAARNAHRLGPVAVPAYFNRLFTGILFMLTKILGRIQWRKNITKKKYNESFTMKDSQWKIHNERFTMKDSQWKIHNEIKKVSSNSMIDVKTWDIVILIDIITSQKSHVLCVWAIHYCTSFVLPPAPPSCVGWCRLYFLGDIVFTFWERSSSIFW